jgi:hypothetical protein
MPTLTAPSAALSDDRAVLAAITRQDCNLAIWQRRLAHDFAPLVAEDAQNIRFECSAGDVADALSAGLAAHGFAAPHLHAALADDAAQLAREFCAALDLARLEVRLERVTSDSCRKFHGDYVTARLITTYTGPGTQWLDARAAEALASGHAPERINQMAPGDVGMFKGKLASDHPAIHRSPPISQTGETRLLLVLNPVSARGH